MRTRLLAASALALVALVGCGGDSPSADEAFQKSGDELACSLLSDRPSGDREALASYVEVAAAAAQDVRLAAAMQSAAGRVRAGDSVSQSVEMAEERCAELR